MAFRLSKIRSLRSLYAGFKVGEIGVSTALNILYCVPTAYHAWNPGNTCVPIKLFKWRSHFSPIGVLTAHPNNAI
jgi:hypothetical protein